MNRKLISISKVILFCSAACPFAGLAQNYGYPAMPPPQYRQPQQNFQHQSQTQYVSPMQFLPTFGRKFGDMFRRVFYGDSPPQGYGQTFHQYQQPQVGQPQTPRPSYQVQPQQGFVPRYETPPARGNNPIPPSSRMNSGAVGANPKEKKNNTQDSRKFPNSTTSRSEGYRPPSITREDAKSRSMDDRTPNDQSSKSVRELPTKLPGNKPSTTLGATDTPSASANSGSFLKGRKTNKEGRVVSPYPPYRELDVTGLTSGSLALDPTTQKVFEVP